jgi:hypothetical protein
MKDIKDKVKSLITITPGGCLRLTKKQKKLQAEAQNILLGMFLNKGKYYGVPMLLMHNLTIKSIEIKDDENMLYFPKSNNNYIITNCSFKNGNRRKPIFKQKTNL